MSHPRITPRKLGFLTLTLGMLMHALFSLQPVRARGAVVAAPNLACATAVAEKLSPPATACPTGVPVTLTPDTSATPDLTQTAVASLTPDLTATARASVTPDLTATAKASETPDLTATAKASITPGTTATARPTATATKTPIYTPTARPTLTQRPTRTPIPTRTPTATPRPQPLNYGIFAVEFTQAIQDLNNSVTLVRGKQTWARVHVQKTSGRTDHWIDARLHLLVNGQRVETLLPYNWNIVPKARPNRVMLNDSFYFALPAHWSAAPSITVEAEINTPRNPAESSWTDNTRRTQANFANTPPISVNAYLVRYTVRGAAHQAPWSAAVDMYDWLRRAYPVPGVRFQVFTLDMRWLGRQPNCAEVNLMLSRTRYWRQMQGLDPRQTRYYGLVSDSGGFMRGCAPSIPSFVASGPTGPRRDWWDIDNGSFGDWYGGHELGHAYGRWHAMFCGAVEGAPYPYWGGRIGGANPADRFYGWDIHLRSFVVYPPNWTDVMTYCPAEWISDFTYLGIRNRVLREGGGFTGAQAANTEPLAIVQGTITIDGQNAALLPVYRHEGVLTAQEPMPGPEGFSIVVRGPGDSVLHTQPFTPRVDTDDHNFDETQMLIEEIVPFPVSATRLEIVRDGAVIGQRVVSANTPVVSITAPVVDGSVDGAGLTVTWTASDADGDGLFASVFWSSDDGASWQLLRADITETSVLIDAGELSGATRGRIRVLVSDGVNSAEAISAATITTLNRAPVVEIDVPATDITVNPDQPVLLSGKAIAPDRELRDDQLVWRSSISGVLGSGPAVVTLLPPGIHVITLGAEDGVGGSVAATRTVTVLGGAVTPAPALVAGPGLQVFVAFAGTPVVLTETVSIRNNAEADLRWTATSSADWLTLDVMSGGTPDDPELQVETAGLPSGHYTGTVRIESAGMVPQTIAVELFVNEPVGRQYLPVTSR
jgi:hypothetical protein